jgi:hypothetical protein
MEMGGQHERISLFTTRSAAFVAVFVFRQSWHVDQSFVHDAGA